MPQPTNLTEGLAHLRSKKRPKAFAEDAPKQVPPTPAVARKTVSARERAMATDYFSLFVYSLLGVATLSQLALIIWFGQS
jgi:hypothetical protein